MGFEELIGEMDTLIVILKSKRISGQDIIYMESIRSSNPKSDKIDPRWKEGIRTAKTKMGRQS